MYLEFRLPIDRHPLSTELLLLRRALVDWSQQHDITYTEKTVKLTHRVCFKRDDEYTFFGITWNPEYWVDYTIINIP